jgi:hypothetical protein
MQICPPNEEKWVLCADSREDYQRWCTTFERFVKEKAHFSDTLDLDYPLNSFGSDDEGYNSSVSQKSTHSSKSMPGPNGKKKNMLNKLIRKGKDEV